MDPSGPAQWEARLQKGSTLSWKILCRGQTSPGASGFRQQEGWWSDSRQNSPGAAEGNVFLVVLKTDSSLPFGLDLTSLGYSGAACPPIPAARQGSSLPGGGSQVHTQSTREDRVWKKGKQGRCPGWVTFIPVWVPEPQSW